MTTQSHKAAAVSKFLSRYFATGLAALGLLCSLYVGETAQAQSAPNILLKLTVEGRTVLGQPLAWNSEEVVLLQADGSVKRFDPSDATDYEKSAGPLKAFTAVEMRRALLQELGSGFDVTGTGHYMVAHPKGQESRWADRFESIYRDFQHYFRVRGYPLTEPEFPFVAIVWPTQEDFLRYAHSHGFPGANRDVLGFYSSDSNRITLYDVTAGKKDDENWHINVETIIHEAVHQTAFNTGVHGRFSTTPKWVVEGLGTLFEAKGVWNSSRYTRMEDRVNMYQLKAFKEYAAARRKPGAFARLVLNDDLFSSNVLDAYAESWAFTFFLSETRPRQFADYLKRTAQRPAFKDYDDKTRWTDFAEHFDGDLRLLENEYLGFIDKLSAKE